MIVKRSDRAALMNSLKINNNGNIPVYNLLCKYKYISNSFMKYYGTAIIVI